MRLPFTVDSFLATFKHYNDALWPAQLILAALAVVLLVLARRGESRTGSWISAGLAAMWLWMAAAYHIAFFRAINPAATLFALGFALEAALLAWFGVVRPAFRYVGRTHTLAGVGGWALIAYALVVYPILGWAVGHHYPEQATFGLPCPTTIFTLGLFLLAEPPVPWSVVVIPLLWSVLGLSAATQLGMVEDFGLAAAALVYVVIRLASGTRSLLSPR